MEEHVAELDGGGGGVGVRDVAHGLDVLPRARQVGHPHKVLSDGRARGICYLHDGEVVVCGDQHTRVVRVEERGYVHTAEWGEDKGQGAK